MSLIPTEVSTPGSTPPPASLLTRNGRKPSNLATTSATARVVSQKRTRRVRAVAVAGSFAALPVQIAADGLVQWIYIRRDEAAVDNEGDDEEEEEDGEKVSAKANRIFVVNLPYGSDEDSVEEGFRRLLAARLDAASSRKQDGGQGSTEDISKQKRAKGKGRASDASDSAATGLGLVDVASAIVSVTILAAPQAGSGSGASRRGPTLLEAEGISHPDLLSKSNDSRVDMTASKSGSSSATPTEHGPSSSASTHPLLVSAELMSARAALHHMYPSTSTVKAHIQFSSSRALSLLLNTSASWSLTPWPSSKSESPAAQRNGRSNKDDDDVEASFLSLVSGSPRRKKSTDELLYDLSRPSLASIKLHVDDWMKHFDATQSSNTAAARRRAAQLTARTEEQQQQQTRSKRALAREAAAKRKALAELERKKAIKKRRLYDDDFMNAEADADGWVTVSRGGRYGRSAGDGGDEEAAGGGDEHARGIVVEDEEDIRQAQMEGFASGKRSVGVASRAFIKEQEEDREEAIKRLYLKLGITSEAGDAFIKAHGKMTKVAESTKQGASAIGGAAAAAEDDSRGGGRGKKKKRTRGIETGMYGFQKREESKKQMSDLRRRFEEDKKRIEDMKRNKRFRPY